MPRVAILPNYRRNRNAEVVKGRKAVKPPRAQRFAEAGEVIDIPHAASLSMLRGMKTGG